jgi:purine-cytosine permease-like protein
MNHNDSRPATLELSTNHGIVLVGVISVITTMFGYRLIHAYTRVIDRAMGGADISWIVGLVVISPIYYVASRRRARRQSVSPVRRNA